jgi:hypothetical protein
MSSKDEIPSLEDAMKSLDIDDDCFDIPYLEESDIEIPKKKKKKKMVRKEATIKVIQINKDSKDE